MGAHHLYPQCSSSTCTGELSPSRYFENSFETSNIVTGRVNVIRAQAHLFKVLYKDELIDLQCETMLYSKLISCSCDFSKFWCGLGEEFPKLFEARLCEIVILLRNTHLCEAGLWSMATIT